VHIDASVSVRKTCNEKIMTNKEKNKLIISKLLHVALLFIAYKEIVLGYERLRRTFSPNVS